MKLNLSHQHTEVGASGFADINKHVNAWTEVTVKDPCIISLVIGSKLQDRNGVKVTSYAYVGRITYCDYWSIQYFDLSQICAAFIHAVPQ